MSKLLDPNFPFAPKSSPIYYGWVIVLASVVGVLASLPGQTNGVGVFNDVLMEVTNLSRTQLSWAYCLGTVVSGLNMTLGGRLLDRFGCRRLVVLASCFLGVILVCLANVDHITIYFSQVFSFLSVATCAFIVLSILFALLRFSGQGMLVLISRQLIGKWFDKKRGFAAACSGIAISLGFGLTPTVFQQLINFLEWRGAWYLLAAISALFMSIFGWLFFRDNPEECGLSMDGVREEDDGGEEQDSAKSEQRSFTLQEARHSWAFWLISLSLSLQGVVGTAIPFHIDQLAIDHGMSKETALTLFIPMSFIAPTVGWCVGWACDRYPMTLLLRIMCVFQILGFASLAFLGNPVAWYLCIAGLAISGGFFGPLSTVAMPFFFGRAHLGAISGNMMKMMVIGSALGPLMFAYSYDFADSFMPACFLSAAVATVMLILAGKAVRPQ